MQNLVLRLKICGRVDCSFFQNPGDTFHQLQTTITNCWIPIFSFTHLALSVGGEEPQKVSEWSRLHAYLWGGESYWESFHRELRSWDHLSSSQHQVYLWEDTKHHEDTRGNLMPGVQPAGVGGKAKTSQRLHWYILAQGQQIKVSGVTNTFLYHVLRSSGCCKM